MKIADFTINKNMQQFTANNIKLNLTDNCRDRATIQVQFFNDKKRIDSAFIFLKDEEYNNWAGDNNSTYQLVAEKLKLTIL